MKTNIKRVIDKHFTNGKRRSEFALYGTYLLIDDEWVRFYVVLRDGIIILREIKNVEYPEYIEYNKLNENVMNLLIHYYIRRIFKERPKLI